jgi:hypothetical protein
MYYQSFPLDIGQGTYDVFYYEQAGGTPSVSDDLLADRPSDVIAWGTGASPQTTTPTISIAGLTKLRAVNQMLGSVGESPVNSLDTGGSSDAARAEAILDEVNEQIQEQGWHCNTEREVSLAVDTDGYIPLAANALRVDATGSSATLDVARRGAYLYNITDDTFVWTAAVTVDIVRLLAFEDLTPALKRFVASEASLRFEKEVQGKVQQQAVLRDEWQKYRTTALREDARNSNSTMLSNPTARRIMGSRYTLDR